MDDVLVYFIQVSSLKWNKVGEKKKFTLLFPLPGTREDAVCDSEYQLSRFSHLGF